MWARSSRPITRAQYLSGGAAVPPQLFSHADQSVQWQTSVPDEPSRTGWGGRMADLLHSLNGNSQISLSISIAGTNTFEVGNQVLPYNVSSDGSIGLSGFDGSANANIRLQAFRDLLALPHNNLFEKAYSDTVTRAIAANDLLTSALAGLPPLQTVFPSDLAGQTIEYGGQAHRRPNQSRHAPPDLLLLGRRLRYARRSAHWSGKPC